MNWPEYCNKILAEVDTEAYFFKRINKVQRAVLNVKLSAHLRLYMKHKQITIHLLLLTLRKGVYYCNSCHSKGNIHTMVRHLEGLSSEGCLVLTLILKDYEARRHQTYGLI